MRLIAVRHGETEWNSQGLVMGQLDSPLTPRGLQQAKAVADRLSRIEFKALYSSDLGRAGKTAEIIAAACDKTVSFDPGLRERHMGIFQGYTLEEMRRKFPKEREEYERMALDYIVPGGEGVGERVDRSVRALTEIADRHRDETVVVVTHGGFLIGFFEFVLGLPPSLVRRVKRYNASYNVFIHGAGNWTLETWNDVSHLQEAEIS